jgi:hypothetical protein
VMPVSHGRAGRPDGVRDEAPVTTADGRATTADVGCSSPVVRRQASRQSLTSADGRLPVKVGRGGIGRGIGRLDPAGGRGGVAVMADLAERALG